MNISFIVLTYNRSDALLVVLQALALQCREGDEVLIADDGSRRDQVALLYAQCPPFNCPVRHVWHPDIGFTAAAARNLAAHYATGEYLVFLDGDCVPGPSFVAAQIRLADPKCFVNGSRVLLSERLTKKVISQQLNLLHQPPRFWHSKLRSANRIESIVAADTLATGTNHPVAAINEAASEMVTFTEQKF